MSDIAIKVEMRRGIVTGAQERSEVEQMIQRYLELAASALREQDQAQHNDKRDVPA